MKGEIHIYVNGMPIGGLVRFWEVNEAINMCKAYIITNQTQFISPKVIEKGYKIFVHKDGISTPVGKTEAAGINKFIRSMQNDD